jgi:hypothetical protein
LLRSGACTSVDLGRTIALTAAIMSHIFLAIRHELEWKTTDAYAGIHRRPLRDVDVHPVDVAWESTS